MILVFGGQGQLGQELQRQAGLAGIALTALSRAECDIADAGAVQSALQRICPSVAVNCAAYTAVDKAESEPELAMHINATSAGVLAQACAMAGVPLIHLSSDYVFDGRKLDAYVESDPIAPLGAYGRSKADGERAVRDQAQRHLILRTSWVYGAFGHNFLKTILRLAADRDELRIVADQRGCPTATPGLAQAILTLAPRLASAALTNENRLWGTYHLTGSGETTWHGFACEIVDARASITGQRPKVTAISTADFPTPAMRPKNSVLDCSQLRRTFDIVLPDWRVETRRIVRDLLERG